MKVSLIVAALCFALPIPASPQSTRDVTVTGSAMRRVAASSAQLVFSLQSADQKPVISAKTLQPVVDALVKAGVAPSAIVLPLAYATAGTSPMSFVRANIPNPTPATIRASVTSAAAAIAGLPDVRLYSARVDLESADCGSAAGEARASALREAQSKAQALASQLHAGVGEALTVHSDDQGDPDGTCSSYYWVGAFGPQNASGPYSKWTDDDYVMIPITSRVTVTYAIK